MRMLYLVSSAGKPTAILGSESEAKAYKSTICLGGLSADPASVTITPVPALLRNPRRKKK